MLTSCGVSSVGQHDLWCSIPSRRDIFWSDQLVNPFLPAIRQERTFCQFSFLSLRFLAPNGIETSGQPKIADFQFATRVYEQVARFEITMDDVGGVDVFHAS